MSAFNLSLNPGQVEYVLKPGITIIQAYEVVNNSNSSITLTSEVLPWIPSGIDGSVNYQTATPNPNLDFSLNNSDLKLGQSFTLAPNSKQQLVLKIKTNPNMPLSDNYYTFFISQNQNPFQSNDSFSQASGKIGSHLLLTVSDTENPQVQAAIQNFSITPKIKDVFFTPIQFTGQVQNNSNFFFKTNGKIIISKNGKTLKELSLDDKNVLNHHSRQFTCQDTVCQIKAPFWPGKYHVSLVLDPSLNTPNIGTSFFVLPISPILFGIIIIGLFITIKFIRNKIIHRI